MFGDYLLRALYTLTEGYDAWMTALVTCEKLKGEQGQGARWIYGVIFLTKLFSDRIRLEDLATTLSCSEPLRKYFLNFTRGEAAPWLLPRANKGFPATQPNKEKLVSLLRVLKEDTSYSGLLDDNTHVIMSENKVYSAISRESNTWVDEISTLIRNAEGALWMTNFAADRVEEAHDATYCFQVFKRIHERENIRTFYPNEDADDWKEYKTFSDKLKGIDPKGEAMTNLVKKHMVPGADQKFDYVGFTSSSPL